jgi:hypothetical protein
VGSFKKFFSRTTGPILTRLDTNHPWEEGIQVCSNEGDCSPPRGGNSRRVKIHWIFLKKSSSPEPAGQNQSNFVQLFFGELNASLFKERARSSLKGR